MTKQARARRQRIPAFGEWNYSYGGDWPVTQYLDSAVPPSPMPVKKKKLTTRSLFLGCLASAASPRGSTSTVLDGRSS